MIYLKKIVNQDLTRTPTFNQESISDFFKIELENGESTVKDVLLSHNNKMFSVEFKKRKTREEHRVFLNDLFKEINPDEGDILIFKRRANFFICEHIPISHKSYIHLNHLFEMNSNHELVVEDEYSETPEYLIDTLEDFITWFIENDGKSHNYFKLFFFNERARVKKKLEKYEQIYEEQFGSKVFSFYKSRKDQFIKELNSNIYLEEGDFFEYSLKSSRHMPRAILGKNNYLKFLDDFLKESVSIDQVEFDLLSFKSACDNAGLIYTEQLLTRFVASLATKPFVLLTGLSGSGKTKLAQAFAQWICASKDQYCIVPVGADWINREPLLGYVNALEADKYIMPENGALRLIIEANKEENEDKPYFLILDEMNLSHVERYFADFLSVMESDEWLKLHSCDTSLDGEDGVFVDKEYKWPDNLFVIGTVNIDETTYMFSPKVLDRANVIEFRISDKDLDKYLQPSNNPLEMEKFYVDNSKVGKGAKYGASFVSIATNRETVKNNETLNKELKKFFVELQKIGAEFGYRSASEIQMLYTQIDTINPEYLKIINEKIDIAIMQKLLPKLHGSRSRLVPVLKVLASLCYTRAFNKEKIESVFADAEKYKAEIKYAISLEKITRMYINVIDNGFTSYAEA